MWVEIFKTLIGPIFGICLGYVANKYNTLKNNKKQQKDNQQALTDGIMILLRFQLRDAYEYYKKQGYCSIDDRTEVAEMYDVYEQQLGGNHKGTDYYNGIMNLPTEKIDRPKK